MSRLERGENICNRNPYKNYKIYYLECHIYEFLDIWKGCWIQNFSSIYPCNYDYYSKIDIDLPFRVNSSY